MSNTLQGTLWALLATALFATVAAMAKVAVSEYHVLQILLIRQGIVFLSAVPSLLKTFPNSLKTQHPVLHALRLLGSFTALSTNIWAVAVLPLTTAVTLAFAQVFFAALLALKFLNEPVGVHRIAAIVVGFVGVVVVMRPGIDGLIDRNALIPVVGAFGAAVAVTCVRRLSQTESTATLLAHQAIFIGAMAGAPQIWLWVTPSWPDFIFLVSLGILATIAQWAGIKALRLGEVSIIGAIEYMKLIYASILGYALFDEVPDLHTVAGAAIIVGSSIYIFQRETM